MSYQLVILIFGVGSSKIKIGLKYQFSNVLKRFLASPLFFPPSKVIEIYIFFVKEPNLFLED